jgi:hypothetical protein
MRMTTLELSQEELSNALLEAIKTGRKLEQERIVSVISSIKDNWRKPSGFNYPKELSRIIAMIEGKDLA